jgi:hypothetical protein
MRLLAAAPDAWVIAVPLIVLLIQIVEAVMMWIVNNKANRIDTLEARLAVKAEELIEVKFQVYATTLEASANTLQAAIGMIQDRLSQGDQDFRSIFDALRDLELKNVQRMESIKDMIRKECVTGEDLRVLDKHFTTLQQLIRSGRGGS